MSSKDTGSPLSQCPLHALTFSPCCWVNSRGWYGTSKHTLCWLNDLSASSWGNGESASWRKADRLQEERQMRLKILKTSETRLKMDVMDDGVAAEEQGYSIIALFHLNGYIIVAAFLHLQAVFVTFRVHLNTLQRKSRLYLWQIIPAMAAGPFN